MQTKRSPSEYLRALLTILEKMRFTALISELRQTGASGRWITGSMPFSLHDAVKRQKAFLQRPDHIHRLRMQLLGGRGHTVLEQLLRQILQRLCPVADLRKVTPDRFAVFLLLQKIQIADERRERRSQVMGKAGNGLLQFQVPLLTAPALFCGADGASRLISAASLRIYGSLEETEMSVLVSDVRMSWNAFCDLLCGSVQKINLCSQDNGHQKQDSKNDQLWKLHNIPLTLYLFFETERFRQPLFPGSTAHCRGPPLWAPKPPSRESWAACPHGFRSCKIPYRTLFFAPST